MKITNPLRFIHMGGRIRYLAGCKDGQKIGGRNMILSNLEKMRDSLKEFGFIVSCNLYDNVLKDFVNRLHGIVDKAEEATLDESLSNELSHAIVDFEKTVNAEALTRTIAVPVPRRVPLEHLLENPDAILGKGVFKKLTRMAKDDLTQACRCIAFECSTASAFHILRCIEECVRILYIAYFPRKKIEHQTWGQLINKLKKKDRNPRPDGTLLTHLDHLRDRFRNPTDHPEKSYEIEEAEDLLHLSVDVINRCIRDPQVEKKS